MAILRSHGLVGGTFWPPIINWSTQAYGWRADLTEAADAPAGAEERRVDGHAPEHPPEQGLRQAVMDLHAGPFMIIQARSLELLVVEVETQRPYQVKAGAAIGGKAYDVAGVGRDFG